MLLTTKFLKPAADVRAVNRSRLHRLLDPSPPKRLNLVVAPAGYGKTTLVSQWCVGLAENVAWLSLDENDNSPRRFWQYVIGAAQHSGVTGTDQLSRRLASFEDHEMEGAVAGLLNALTQTPALSTIVLDDFHLIQDPKIHRQFAYFIDYLPPGITVTITSRTEPELPLERWRVRQWVTDIQPQVLAFSESECRHFFRDYMALSLSDEESRQIWRQTEGWVAAMQLTALSGRSPDNADESPKTLEVGGQQINRYVFSEILDQQPEDIRQFLLDTAMTSRLSGSLCDAMRANSDSQAFLERLIRLNLFVIPLDSKNEWFRYHDLFRDALLQRARALDGDRVNLLEQRAVDWLLTHDHVQEAVAQVISRKDWARLATVLEQHGNNLIQGGHHLPVLEWLQKLPSDILINRPQLLMVRIWGLFFANRLSQIEVQLSDLEDILDRRVADSHPDAEGALALHNEISLIRSYIARSKSDDKSAQDLTQQVLREIDHTRIPLKSVTYYGLGLDYFGQGDLGAAEEALAASVRYGQLERKASTVLSSGGLLAWIQYSRGEIDQALETSTDIRTWVDDHFYDPSQPRLISCWQNSTLVEIYRERKEKELSDASLLPLLDHLENGTEPGQHVVIQHVRGHQAFSEARYEDAILALEDAESVARRRREHIVFEPPASGALLVRCHLAANEVSKAKAWLRDWQQRPQSSPLNDCQNAVSAARVHIRLGQFDLACTLLADLLTKAEAEQNSRLVIEVLLVYASSLGASGQLEEARNMLERALDYGAEGGFFQIFLDEPDSLKTLLLTTQGIQGAGHWHTRLRDALEKRVGKLPRQTTNGAGSDGLIEPLSQREQEVLGLINEGLANKDIAEKMAVAATTVKAHIRNLYGKLDVGSRTEALAKARHIGLL
ncbi:LuxR family transcriptional regulator, maltose regulon positive regulatory protein [Marinobacter zhejiangensis]|uniref:LuxR family transcriptional regulator, maltose regulon positive regulatory protein n=2 Tax=Marinobacter zhejiangensis TaxID=488535 RepID=A0A1I4RSC6_9GAMM|nr:LuxR family transcriptional regulator, maltose regulon positive regulatory protein [Marinobacter zhejiangensis]